MINYIINGKIGFYDLRNYCIDNTLSNDALIIKESLPHKIKIEVYNNFYYLFDFRDTDIKWFNTFTNFDNPKSIENSKKSISFHVQKEIINAFNACIYIKQVIPKDNNDLMLRLQMSNDIDQFFLPNPISSKIQPLSKYIDNRSLFSSEAYRIACEHIYYSDIPKNIIPKELIENSINFLNEFLKDINPQKDYNMQWFYLLAQIWKAVHHKKHDMRIESVNLLRAIYEIMVRKKYSSDDITEKQYSDYCGNSSDFFKEFANVRHRGSHTLIIPTEEDLMNLDKYIKEVIVFFQRDSYINIDKIYNLNGN